MSSAPCCANFWSHTIYDWGDVVPPVSYGDGISDAKCVVSGLQMDYRRFQNQAQLACYTNERDAIRAYDAATPITTNLMGTFKDLDYFEWAKEMDVVSWDNYPDMDTPPSFTAMCHDLMRGIGGNKPFMLMEQTPNQQNWFPFCKVKRPGEVRQLSWQAVSHGADTVQFFQMKQSIGGCERFHGAVIAHDGTEQSRVFKETAALGGELDRIGKRIMGSEIRAKVAIMFDWQSYWSLEGCVGPTAGFSYPNEVHRFYRAFWRRNVPVDIIESTTPLDKLKQYDLVVAPALITVLPGVAETLESYVSEGGSFITGYMAGIHDEHDLVVPGGYPGKLRDLMGVWVEEIDALTPDETIEVHGDAVDAKGEIVASIIHREGARRLAAYGGGEFYAGHSALTVNTYGKGKAYFVGTPLDETGMSAFMAPIIKELGLKPLDTPEDVSLSVRYGDDGVRYAFLINNSESGQEAVPGRAQRRCGTAHRPCGRRAGRAQTVRRERDRTRIIGIGVVTWQDVSDATEYARASRRTLYWSQVLNSIEDRLDSDMTAKRRILAFEIGTFFTRYVVFEDGRMGIPGTIATPVDSVESFYQALAHIVNGQRAPLDGIAMSVPGFIDVSKQVAVTAGALGMLYKHEIGKELQEYLDKPVPTWMENDANCAAMAEKLSGNAVKLDDFALITIDTGIGGALFLDGGIRRGKDWRAGELGMMIPNYETGGFNTMQNYLSTIVLAEDYAKEFDVPTGSIVPATLFRRLDEPRVRKIVDEWIDYLAIAIFNTAAATDPECILLGGGICREQQLLPMVNAALDRIPQWGDFRTSVKRCRHTNNAGLIGAYYAFETEVGGLTDVPIR